ncbi:MAG TPA: transposase, partial [Anaerovoracaceae bacterium]|nr:transposase [Anaerovoracaceae bacterium]
MAIIYQTDKRSGITYAYEAAYFWNKEKQQSRSKRKLIGRVDVQTGEIVPTDGRMKRSKDAQGKTPKRRGPAASEYSVRTFYGATYLLDAIGDKLGITQDLRTCFPEAYKQILSIAYYLILEDSNPLSRFEKWGNLHKHPFGRDIPSQRSSELFMSISGDARNRFFVCQGKRRFENEYWAYDTSSFSCYSEALRQVQYGNNKENDKLPQLNLALVFGEQSNLPFYYRKLAGNIPDVKTVKNLIADLNLFGFKKVKLIMDRGFYSEENINALYREHLKFLVSAETSLSFIREELDKVYDDFRTFEYYNDNYELYSTTIQSEWNYTQKRP